MTMTEPCEVMGIPDRGTAPGTRAHFGLAPSRVFTIGRSLTLVGNVFSHYPQFYLPSLPLIDVLRLIIGLYVFGNAPLTDSCADVA